MSDKASIIINSTTTTGNDKSMSVGYVNPNATPAELIEFAQAINGLTENNYSSTTLVEKTELVNKPTRSIDGYVQTMSGETVEVALTTISHANLTEGQALMFSQNNRLMTALEVLPYVIKNTSDLCIEILHSVKPEGGSGIDGIGFAVVYDEDASSQIRSIDGWVAYDMSGNQKTADGNGEIVFRFPATTQYAQTDLTITVTA